MSEHNGSTGFPPQAVARNVSEFARNVITLAELQSELLKVDAQESLKKLIAPVVLLVTTVVIILGCVPVLLTALALGLAEAGLADWLAFLVAAGIGLALAAMTGLVGWQRLRKLPAILGRSKQEFSCNVAWVKEALTNTPRLHTPRPSGKPKSHFTP